MSEPRTVVITGASRGLGFASAVRLYREGWRVVAAMRTPDEGMPLLRRVTGATEDERLIGVQLDLTDNASIAAAAKAIEEAVGAPYALVHNAGISAAGMVEETDMALWQRMFATSVLGPVALTQALLPKMRAAGTGRIVLISSAAGVRGQPATAPYSAAKGALERWGEAMACEIAPFGLGVTVVVAGTYDTEIITDAGTTDDRNFEGPYARLHNTMNSRGRFAMKMARPPERFTDGLLKALEDRAPFRRRGIGADASILLAANRILPASGMHHMSRTVLGIPRQGSMRGGAWPLTWAQKAMVLAARVLPQPVLQRLAALAGRRQQGSEGN
ncbi:SDR family oxidoreductase [Mycobacterium intracellulare]|uniref:NAD dependent epimerase/dehydratase family protein n=1 Tax=Mycobacterium intracellulare subsp. chimaera TaxID=222805 RepID=A0A220Y8Q8_MYCIT|nr:SDR family oxidoreductase [Mycobacterium intracellulare]AOS91254.1 short-chain dehydrogenase/reductase [Mycobacterium intracellulare subsp. chimaera]ARV81259.1 short-chain dehydrogenase/reductase [Mycobacterium intracellulare subsp. chimaera]ASL08291.1 NAD dependent epimerase/dehydratase family protein [Mycobacterium intracellulare subsp. chimaera]ASL13948.1 NAD dependent epimerase/dehydratase family protein [Mycobacterium intracellulare subsp. chimaera]ASL20076.1 NAD dependent epimerase/de